MQLLICVCIAWMTIILFAFLPKRLSILDFVFLYGVVLSLTSTLFTVLGQNLHILKIPTSRTDLLAVTVFRGVTIPLFILMSINALQRKPQWIMLFFYWLLLTTHDWALFRFKVMHYHLLYPWPIIGLVYLGLILVVWALMWWYKRFDDRKVGYI